jgi:hypothetical protein
MFDFPVKGLSAYGQGSGSQQLFCIAAVVGCACVFLAVKPDASSTRPIMSARVTIFIAFSRAAFAAVVRVYIDSRHNDSPLFCGVIILETRTVNYQIPIPASVLLHFTF